MFDAGSLRYSEYLGARSAEQAREHGCWALANPLAVCAVVVTDDGWIVVEKRAASALYGGRVHVVGGYLDPVLDLNLHAPDPWLAVARECSEEIGWRPARDDLQLLGLAYDLETPHPELCFATRAPLSFDDFASRARASGEFSPARVLPDDGGRIAEALDEPDAAVVPSARAALVLYGRRRFGERWFAGRLAANQLCRLAPL